MFNKKKSTFISLNGCFTIEREYSLQLVHHQNNFTGKGEKKILKTQKVHYFLKHVSSPQKVTHILLSNLGLSGQLL